MGIARWHTTVGIRTPPKLATAAEPLLKRRYLRVAFFVRIEHYDEFYVNP